MTSARAPWREPMLWLVMGLPAAAVVASVLLIVSAVRSGGDDAVIDTVDRMAQVQIADLGADARAQQLGLRALLRVDGDSIELLPVAGPFDRARPLRLHASHPARADQDVQQLLAISADGWRGVLPDHSHDWLLSLEPQDRSWRLKGRLRAAEQATLLQPSLPLR